MNTGKRNHHTVNIFMILTVALHLSHRFSFTHSFQTSAISIMSTRRSSRLIAHPSSPIATKAHQESISPSTPKKRKATNKVKTPSPKKRSPKKTVPKKIMCSNDLAKISPENQWIDLMISPKELRPSATLTTGQCFNWMVVQDDLDDKNLLQSSSAWGTHNETEWVGPVQDFVISIKETPSTTLYRILHGPEADISEFLGDYFQLSTPLEPLYVSWSKSDERLARIANVIPGVRLIRQNPVECLFSFICSSNNNIPRITKMLSSFRQTFGKKMIDLPLRLSEDDVLSEPLEECMTLYSFPTLEELKIATEQQLRDMGLGYRAKFIIQTRDLLIDSGGQDFLYSLREKDAETVQEELIKFSGIGRKVADCVGLFSLDQTEAVPVDVHVGRIASRDYDPTVLGQSKSLTPTVYKNVGDLFRDRFEYAGWAHSVLFVAELRSFRDVLPKDIVVQMDNFREAEQSRKAEEKEAKVKSSPKK